MGIINNGISNWKTTALGAAGLAQNLISNADVLANGTVAQKIQVVITSIGMFLMGLFAKDADKTGVLTK